MTDPDSTTAGGGGEERTSVQLPSFEELEKVQDCTLVSEDARRIRWALDGPVTAAISVMQHAKIDPDDAVFEPYYRAPDGADPSWHPISQSPYTTPKVSSITITWIDPLDEWESYWSEKHQEHVDAGDYDPAKARFGPLPDPDETGHSSYELESGRYLQACCGTERPVYEQTKLLVKATGDFVTIHDFISVVHPYLMARRGEIVAAMREEQYRGSPVPAETDMMVTLTTPTSLYVTDQSEWLEYHQKPRKVVHDPATQARLAIFDAKIRAAGLGRPGATSS